MFAALGVLLIVAGAIITFAIDKAVDGVDLEALGYILMAGGALSLIIGAIQGAGFMSMGRQRVTSERIVSPDGHHVVEDTETR
jgi:Domain of unknown function (DUF6458)